MMTYTVKNIVDKRSVLIHIGCD